MAPLLGTEAPSVRLAFRKLGCEGRGGAEGSTEAMFISVRGSLGGRTSGFFTAIFDFWTAKSNNETYDGEMKINSSSQPKNTEQVYSMRMK